MELSVEQQEKYWQSFFILPIYFLNSSTVSKEHFVEETASRDCFHLGCNPYLLSMLTNGNAFYLSPPIRKPVPSSSLISKPMKTKVWIRWPNGNQCQRSVSTNEKARCIESRRYDLWLSIITLFLILVFEASRAPFELFNIHHVLTNWNIGLFPIQVIIFSYLFNSLNMKFQKIIEIHIFIIILLTPHIFRNSY